jgi:hypothetical protein
MAPDDDIARLRAESDQAKEGMKEFAGNLWAFYSALLEEGFDPSQAITLTLSFLGETVSMPKGDEG